MPDNELDVRRLRKPDKHPMIFARYAALPTGGSFVLVNNHDPKHLRAEFDTEHPGGYGWEYLEKGPEVWRIRISKLTTTPLPRVLADTNDTHDTAVPTDATGAAWKLEVRERHLDSNIVALPPGGGIGIAYWTGSRRLDPRLVWQRPAEHRGGHHQPAPGRTAVAATTLAPAVHCRPSGLAIPHRA
ncbi:DUF2249 domain-containing protein [Mycobacterium kansasii]|uniref:DUF2249 domain-containing protein n=1 Tax=Mycobacterium kansasii TaxID=1768 RepID=UPI00358DAEDA